MENYSFQNTHIYIDSVEYLQDYTFIKKSSQGCIGSVKHRVMHSRIHFIFRYLGRGHHISIGQVMLTYNLSYDFSCKRYKKVLSMLQDQFSKYRSISKQVTKPTISWNIHVDLNCQFCIK